MPDQPRLIRVFLSSPGDVPEERKIATSVLDALQYDPTLRGKVKIEVVAWDQPGSDTPLLANMTPQEAINQGMPVPADCDVVVVIFWSRMGTPLPPEYTKPNGDRYMSGTEWEFLNAVNAATEAAKKGDGIVRPRVVVYRRMDKINLDPDDVNFEQKTEQWRRVKNFFNSFVNPDGSLRQGYNSYESPENFRIKFDQHVKKLIAQLITIPGFGSAAPETPIKLWKGSPFPGLRAFTPDDEPIFYGRGGETDDLVDRLRVSRFVAVVGASGSGKSSLVAAGLLPRLTANAIDGSKDWILPTSTGEMDDRVWVGARFTPGENPNPFVPLANRLGEALKREPAELAAALEAEPERIEEFFSPLFAGRAEWTELVIFVDQFEELLTLSDKNRIDPFVRMLRAIHDSKRLRVVLTLRADFYARCVEILPLTELLKNGTFPLSAPGSAALYEMIAKPAERAGLVFEDGLIDKILTDTGADAGSLALLAYLLDELYRKSITGNQNHLTIAQYDALGGVQGAIGKRAEEVVGVLPAEEQAALPRLFNEIVEVDARGRGTRRRAVLDRLTSDPAIAHAVEVLISARLLVTYEGEDGHSIVEVAHEALVREWDRLAVWITGAQADLLLRRQLEQAAHDWNNATADKESYGLIGDRLLEAHRWRTHNTADPQVAAFIDASEQYDIARRAQEDRRKSELIAAEKASRAAATRANRRTRIALLGTALAAIVALVAIVLISNAQARTQAANKAVIAANGQATNANIQVAEAGIEAGKAKTQAAIANDNATLAQVNIAEANLQVASVNTQAAGANVQVVNANATLDKIPPELTKSANQSRNAKETAQAANTAAAGANTQVADANTKVADASISLADAQARLIPIPVTLTLAAIQGQNAGQTAVAANAVAAQANLQVTNVGRTLTPISVTLAAVSDQAQAAQTAAAQANLQITSVGRTLTPIPLTLTTVARRGQASNLAAEAVSELAKDNGGNAELASLLAIRSLETGYTSAADTALQRASVHLYTLKVIAGDSAITAVAYSPDGNTVLTGSASGKVTLWDASTSASTDSPQPVLEFTGQSGSITGAAFSSDGSLIATTSTDKTLIIWSVKTGKPIKTITNTAALTSVAFSPDSKSVVAGSTDKTAKLWDVNSGKLLQTFQGHHSNTVTSVAYSADGTNTVLTGSLDGTAVLWNANTGDPRFSAPLQGQGPLTGVAISRDGRYALTGSEDGSVEIWNLFAGLPQSFHTLFGHTSSVTSVAFSPDGKTALSGSSDRTARLWSVSSGQPLQILGGHTDYVTAVAFSSDGKTVLTGSNDKSARLWNASGENTNALDSGNAVTAVAFSADGKTIMTGGRDLTPQLWDLTSHKSLRVFSGHTNYINAVALSPDGKYALTGSSDKTVLLWDLNLQSFVQRLSGHTDLVTSVAFSPDSKFALTGSYDDTVILWKLDSAQMVQVLKGHKGHITGVAFSPDGKLALSGSADGTARLWDLSTGKTVQTFDGQNGAIESVAFSPDGHYVVTAGDNRAATLWDVTTGQVATFSATGKPAIFTGHASYILGVAFSPNGRYLLTGSDDHTARLWDVTTGQTLRVFSGHTNSVRGVAFSPDGKLALTGSYDGTARLWNVDYQDMVVDACTRVLRDFTGDERTLYGLEDNQPTCPQFADASSPLPTATPAPSMTVTPTATPTKN